MTTEQHDPIVGGEQAGEQVEEPVIDSQESKPDAPAELRAAYKRLKDENKELRADAMQTHLATFDLNTQSGLGVAVAKHYDGPVNAEALATHLRDEYGIESAVTPPASEETQALDRLDQAMQNSVPVEPAPIVAPGQAAIDKMDANDPEAGRDDALASMRAKSARYQEIQRPN